MRLRKAWARPGSVRRFFFFFLGRGGGVLFFFGGGLGFRGKS